MKICMIGCGNHSTFVHGPSYKKYAALHKNIELAACCDLSPETAAQYAKEFGFARSYSNYMEMLDAEKPDMVCIILPITLTEKVAIEVLEAGYNCIIEKPPALTPEGVLNIKAAQEKAQKQLRVCFNRRYMPLVRYVIGEIAKAGESIQAIHYEMHRYRRGCEDFSSTAIHGIDLVKHVAGAEYANLRFDYYPIENNDQKGSHIYLSGQSEKGTALRLAFIPLSAADRECISVHTPSTSYFVELPVTKYDRDGMIRVIKNGTEAEVSYAQLAANDGEEYFARNGFYNCTASFLDALTAGEDNREGLIASTVQSVEVAQCVSRQQPVYVLS
ncbi:MAG: Gfo/Idh/MocA family oxidoreductase [Defluviitaleaceae bacterium]|nr:Gfo/Idh/MocA family oxidoreductase [Defluviitaleaceae bacterium]